MKISSKKSKSICLSHKCTDCGNTLHTSTWWKALIVFGIVWSGMFGFMKLMGNFVPQAFYDPYCSVDKQDHGVDTRNGNEITVEYNIDCKHVKPAPNETN